MDVRILDVPLMEGKAMMLSYNKSGRSLMDYDEALVVCSLKKDHLLDQSAISHLIGYSRSWVCRRLALVEKLDPSVQEISCTRYIFTHRKPPFDRLLVLLNHRSTLIFFIVIGIINSFHKHFTIIDFCC